MATLTVQNVDDEGKDLTLAAASGSGDEWPNSGDEDVIVKNDSGAGVDVTITAQVTDVDDRNLGSLAAQDKTQTVSANGGVAIFSGLSRKIHNDSSGNAQITYSATTSVEVAVVKRQ